MDFDEPPRKTQKAKAAGPRANGSKYPLPVVLPAYGHDKGLLDNIKPCMLYLENITVVVLDAHSLTNGHTAWSVTLGNNTGDTYTYSDDYVVCPGNNKTDLKFTIDLNLADTYTAFDSKGEKAFSVSGNLQFTLYLVEKYGIDYVTSTLDAISISSSKGGDFGNIKKTPKNFTSTNIRSYYGYNFACDATQAVWFEAGKGSEYLVGIMLNNVQVFYQIYYENLIIYIIDSICWCK